MTDQGLITQEMIIRGAILITILIATAIAAILLIYNRLNRFFCPLCGNRFHFKYGEAYCPRCNRNTVRKNQKKQTRKNRHARRTY